MNQMITATINALLRKLRSTLFWQVQSIPPPVTGPSEIKKGGRGRPVAKKARTRRSVYGELLEHKRSTERNFVPEINFDEETWRLIRTLCSKRSALTKVEMQELQEMDKTDRHSFLLLRDAEENKKIIDKRMLGWVKLIS